MIKKSILMLHFRYLAVLLLFIGLYSPAQQKQITLQDILNGTSGTERIDVLHSMNYVKQSSVLNFDHTCGAISSDVYEMICKDPFLMTLQENQGGYDYNSPENHLEKLKGDFLLIYGTGDDDMHVQNTRRMAEALIQADKQFEWITGPFRNHGICSDKTRLHHYRKMTKSNDRGMWDRIERSSEIKKMNV